MAPRARRKSIETDGGIDAIVKGDPEQACAELIALAGEKLGRPLAHQEQQLIRGFDKRLLAEGYYAELFRRFSSRELLDCLGSVARTRREFAEIQRQRDSITARQLEQGRADLARLMSDKLGRSLSTSEQKVIRGWDKSLVAGGDMAELIRGQSRQELLDFLAEAGAGPGPVALLRSLATGRSSLELGREQVIEFLNSMGREALAGLDFGSTMEDFSRWLLETLQAEPPGREIRALYFGLFEQKGGCMLHVAGANAYDAEDSDWAYAINWAPKTLFAPFGQALKIWSELRSGGEEPWVVAQGIATIMVRVFFDDHHAEFRKLTGLKSVHVACGFDDGDMYVLRTPLSPRA
jgi:hypothetical protein